jgi:hypothetical protein
MFSTHVNRLGFSVRFRSLIRHVQITGDAGDSKSVTSNGRTRHAVLVGKSTVVSLAAPCTLSARMLTDFPSTTSAR